jgi:hypothetical protein
MPPGSVKVRCELVSLARFEQREQFRKRVLSLLQLLDDDGSVYIVILHDTGPSPNKKAARSPKRIKLPGNRV